jgi:hypothetical protein
MGLSGSRRRRLESGRQASEGVIDIACVPAVAATILDVEPEEAELEEEDKTTRGVCWFAGSAGSEDVEPGPASGTFEEFGSFARTLARDVTRVRSCLGATRNSSTCEASRWEAIVTNER